MNEYSILRMYGENTCLRLMELHSHEPVTYYISNLWHVTCVPFSSCIHTLLHKELMTRYLEFRCNLCQPFHLHDFKMKTNIQSISLLIEYRSLKTSWISHRSVDLKTTFLVLHHLLIQINVRKIMHSILAFQNWSFFGASLLFNEIKNIEIL